VSVTASSAQKTLTIVCRTSTRQCGWDERMSAHTYPRASGRPHLSLYDEALQYMGDVNQSEGAEIRQWQEERTQYAVAASQATVRAKAYNERTARFRMKQSSYFEELDDRNRKRNNAQRRRRGEAEASQHRLVQRMAGRHVRHHQPTLEGMPPATLHSDTMARRLRRDEDLRNFYAVQVYQQQRLVGTAQDRRLRFRAAGNPQTRLAKDPGPARVELPGIPDDDLRVHPKKEAALSGFEVHKLRHGWSKWNTDKPTALPCNLLPGPDGLQGSETQMPQPWEQTAADTALIQSCIAEAACCPGPEAIDAPPGSPCKAPSNRVYPPGCNPVGAIQAVSRLPPPKNPQQEERMSPGVVESQLEDFELTVTKLVPVEMVAAPVVEPPPHSPQDSPSLDQEVLEAIAEAEPTEPVEPSPGSRLQSPLLGWENTVAPPSSTCPHSVPVQPQPTACI